MGQKLSPEQMRLYRFVDEILFYKWDPIGVSSIDADSPTWPRDEYQAYLPVIFRMVLEDNKAEEIAKHLSDLRTDRMGLKANLKEDTEIAKFLLGVKANYNDLQS